LGAKGLKEVNGTAERAAAGGKSGEEGGLGGLLRGCRERSAGPARTENAVGRVQEFEKGSRSGLKNTTSVIRNVVNTTRSTSFFSFKLSMPSGTNAGTKGPS